MAYVETVIQGVGGSAAPVPVTNAQAWTVAITDLTNILGTSAHPLIVSASASDFPVNLDKWAGTSLGAPTNFGTTPGAVIAGTVNASLFQGTTVVANSTPLFVNVTDGTHNTTIKAASTAAVDADTSIVVQLNPKQPNLDTPLNVQAQAIGTSNASAATWTTATTVGTAVTLVNASFLYNTLVATFNANNSVTGGTVFFDVSNDGSNWVNVYGEVIQGTTNNTGPNQTQSSNSLTFTSGGGYWVARLNISGYQYARITLGVAITGGGGSVTIGYAAQSSGTSSFNPSVSAEGAFSNAPASTLIAYSNVSAQQTAVSPTNQLPVVASQAAGASPWITQDEASVTQGSTTSGQNGILIQGAVTTSAPSYSTGKTDPLSLDTSGNLRVSAVQGTSPWICNVTQWNAQSLGSPTAFGTAPAGNVIPSNSALFAKVGGTETALTANSTTAPIALDVNVYEYQGVAISATNPVPITIADSTHQLTAALSAYGSAPTGTFVMGVNAFITNGINIGSVNGTSLGSPTHWGTAPATSVNVLAVNAELFAGQNALSTTSVTQGQALNVFACNTDYAITGAVAGSTVTVNSSTATGQLLIISGSTGGVAGNPPMEHIAFWFNVQGSVTGGAVIFEASMDSSNWLAATGFNSQTGAVQGSTLNFSGLSSPTSISIPTNGYQYFRIRLTSALTGTGDIQLTMAGYTMQGANPTVYPTMGYVTTSAPTYSTGASSPLSLDTSGNLRVTGSFSNPAVGATGSAVPSSADYEGINVGGTLRGWTGVNPSGSIYAGQIDLASIAGTTVASNNISGNLPVGNYGTGNTSAAAWTSSTSVNTAQTLVSNISGYSSISVTLNQAPSGTLTGGAVTFEASNDNSNWYPVSGVDPNTLATIGPTYTLVAAAYNIFMFTLPAPYFRVRLSTAITGSGTVTVGYAVDTLPSVHNLSGTFSGAVNVNGSQITLQASQVSAVANGTTTRTTTTGLAYYEKLSIVINITSGGAATGTLQLFLEDSFDGGTTWSDLVSSNTFTFGSAATTQGFFIQGEIATSATQGAALATESLSAGTVRSGPWGDRIRVREKVSGVSGSPTGVTYTINCVAKA